MIMYFHPWEFDPEQPRVKDVRFSYSFRHYVGLETTLLKLDKFISESLEKGINFREISNLLNVY